MFCDGKLCKRDKVPAHEHSTSPNAALQSQSFPRQMPGIGGRGGPKGMANTCVGVKR